MFFSSDSSTNTNGKIRVVFRKTEISSTILRLSPSLSGIAHDYGLNGAEPVEIIGCNDNKFSSLLVKRLIISLNKNRGAV
jgi:hypothetical protein